MYLIIEFNKTFNTIFKPFQPENVSCSNSTRLFPSTVFWAAAAINTAGLVASCRPQFEECRAEKKRGEAR